MNAWTILFREWGKPRDKRCSCRIDEIADIK